MPETAHRFPMTPRAEQSRLYDTKRGSSAARGYGARWQKARLAFLAEHPLCMICNRKGISQSATVVDHLLPWTPENGLQWERLGWSPLCFPHHDVDKQRADRFANTVRGQLRLPSNTLTRSAIAVTMVCGPAGAGKSTFVYNNKDFTRDLVIDLDDILRQMHGTHGYRRGFDVMRSSSGDDWDHLLDSALEKRNGILRSLADDRTHERAWFIVAAPHCDDRRKWNLLLRPERIVILWSNLQQCERRIRADPARQGHQTMMIEWARDWKNIYETTLDEFSVGERRGG